MRIHVAVSLRLDWTKQKKLNKIDTRRYKQSVRSETDPTGDEGNCSCVIPSPTNCPTKIGVSGGAPRIETSGAAYYLQPLAHATAGDSRCGAVDIVALNGRDQRAHAQLLYGPCIECPHANKNCQSSADRTILLANDTWLKLSYRSSSVT